MAQLSTVVASILRDCIEAQHKADRLSQKLRGDYLSHGPLEGFRLPGVEIDEVELDLKYVVREADRVRASAEVDPRAMEELFAACASEIAAVAAEETKDGMELAASNRMRGEEHAKTIRSGYERFLRQRVQGTFGQDRGRIVSASGEVDAARMIRTALAAIDEHLLRNEELAEHAARAAGTRAEAWKSMQRQRIGEAVDRIVRDKVGQHDLLRSKRFLSLDIEVAGSELEKASPATLHTIRLRVAPRYYDLLADDNTKEP